MQLITCTCITVSEVTWNVSNGMLNISHSLTHLSVLSVWKEMLLANCRAVLEQLLSLFRLWHSGRHEETGWGNSHPTQLLAAAEDHWHSHSTATCLSVYSLFVHLLLSVCGEFIFTHAIHAVAWCVGNVLSVCPVWRWGMLVVWNLGYVETFDTNN